MVFCAGLTSESESRKKARHIKCSELPGVQPPWLKSNNKRYETTESFDWS